MQQFEECDTQEIEMSIIEACQVTVNPRPQEENVFTEIREAKPGYFGLFAKQPMKRWQVVGPFQPISTFVPSKDLPPRANTGAWAHRIIKTLQKQEDGALLVWSTMYVKLYPRVEQDLIPMTQELLRKNCFIEFDQHCLYHKLSFVNHFCEPNIFIAGEYFIVLCDIPAGKELLIAYNYEVDTAKRREKLFNQYGFVCDCSACTLDLPLDIHGTFKKRLMGACAACNKEKKGLLTCKKCKIARYCNSECQKIHWAAHKLVCSTFEKAIPSDAKEKQGAKKVQK